jgi:hypothetical protein
MHEGKKTSKGKLIRTKNIKANGKRENKDKKRNAKVAFCTSVQTACSFIYLSNTTEHLVARQMCPIRSLFYFIIFFFLLLKQKSIMVNSYCVSINPLTPELKPSAQRCLP